MEVPFLLCIAIPFRKLLVHLLECVTGNAKRGQNLLPGFFALAALFSVVPQYAPPARLPERLKPPAVATSPCAHEHARCSGVCGGQGFPLQAGRSRPAQHGLLQLLFEIVHRFKLHECTP